jgi:RNA polymerase sigma factor (sigma-70 family)
VTEPLDTELVSLDAPGPSDAELITAVRAGDTSAFGPLFDRHVGAARALARQLTRDPNEADDLVSESFAKVLTVVQAGGGPDVAFRAYLLTTLRRCAYDRSRTGARVEVSDDLTAYDPGVPFVDPALEGLERSLVSRAYLTLPERWQTVLWHTEVEGLNPAQVAPLLGLTANGVAALAYRAREGLRQAYLQQHLMGPLDADCKPYSDRLGAYARGGLSKRETSQVEGHLETCERCRALVLELTEVSHGMRAIIAPLFLGLAAAGYLKAGALLGTGSAAAAAAAAAHSGGVGAGGTAGAAGAGAGAAGGSTAAGAVGGAVAGAAGVGVAGAAAAAVGLTTGGAAAAAAGATGGAAGGAAAGGAAGAAGAISGAPGSAATAAGAAATGAAGGAGSAGSGGVAGGSGGTGGGATAASAGGGAAGGGGSGGLLGGVFGGGWVAGVAAAVIAVGGTTAGVLLITHSSPGTNGAAGSPTASGPSIPGPSSSSASTSPTPPSASANGQLTGSASGQGAGAGAGGTGTNGGTGGGGTGGGGNGGGAGGGGSGNTPQPTVTTGPTGTTPTSTPSTTPTTTATPTTTPTVTPTTTPTAPPKASLIVAYAPVGNLVQGRPGIIGFAVANTGLGASGQVTATVALPPGVTFTVLRSGQSSGAFRAASLSAAGQNQPAWQCQATTTGATCTFPSLAAGQSTHVLLDVAAAPGSAGTVPVTVTVTAPGLTPVSASGLSGVQASGLAASFAASGSVSVTAVGNGLLSCPAEQHGCAQAQQRQGDATDNDLWNMTWFDADGDTFPGTYASSAANLTLPTDGTVVWAGLYWSGGWTGTSSESLLLKAPAAPGYETVTAGRVDTNPGVNYPVFQAFANVTTEVEAGGSGTWWAANPAVLTGPKKYAGWSLVVVSSDPGVTGQSVAVYDGFNDISTKTPLPVQIAADPGQTLAVGAIGWEGDQALVGDSLYLDGNALTPTGGSQDSNNWAQSWADGAVGPTNSFGTDVATFSPAVVPDGPTHAITAATGQDNYYIGVLTVTASSPSAQ